ncbi:hypothetical protein RF11_00607 [Thelohanellus kitauei]|uniref:Tc1-like transposase DDE domain-containing protein n=1 Tax=Thelohanellus kitauei TaxID=669202 RepID=A0A0C2M956_THEKT|nr:hypothetical protein RF11_00607 [Thelohanellus kitauei]
MKNVLFNFVQPPFLIFPSSKNISECCAMAKTGVVYFEINDRPYNKDSFKSYICQLITHLASSTDGRCCFIMDYVTFHKCDVIKQEFHFRGHTIEYLSPCSPFLNPIENIFRKWKNFVNRPNWMKEQQYLSCMNKGL